MELAVQLENLGVTIGGHTILTDICADIRAGEWIGIFGPNGAGKTTLIRTILGIQRPTKGSVQVLGMSPRQAAPFIGYMPQSQSSLEGYALSVRAVIQASCHGTLWGVPWTSSCCNAEIDRVLTATGAIAYANKAFSVLSGGERQRVMLSQALLSHPKILLLDEPLAGLDPKNQSLLIDCISHVQEMTKATILFVAHDLNPLIHSMDRLMYLSAGRALLGSLDEVVNSTALSALYGCPIEVIHSGDRVFVVSGDGELPVMVAA